MKPEIRCNDNNLRRIRQRDRVVDPVHHRPQRTLYDMIVTRIASPAFQLKITLRNIRPPVWRRVVVDPDRTLAHLHSVLQTAFGWEDYHLHMFTADGVNYGVPSPDDWEPVRDERRVKLNKLLREPKETLLYEYDFGDSWEHVVVLEKILPAPEHPTPYCSGGRRACPPEDSGGPWGYADFLAAISDAGHPEHESYLEWVGGSFDPEAFDRNEVSGELSTLRRRGRRA